MAYFDEYYGDDPKKMAARDRVLALGRERDFWGASQSQMDTQNGLENHFRNAAYGQYDPILEGRGGYSPEDRANILRESELGDLAQTEGERQESFLSPEEEAGITGNPDAERAYFDPNRQREQFTDAAKRQREIGGSYAGAATAAAEDPRLQLSSEFSEDYQMTPEEAQAIQNSAAMDVRDSYSALESKLGRDAYAEGAGVAGEAVSRGRLERQAASQAADAMTRARVQTDAEAASRKRGIEEMRLGSEQDIAGRRMGAAQFGGTLRSGIERGLGEQGMGLEQDIRDFGSGQERYIDATRSERTGQVAGNRQEAARYNQGERYNRGLTSNQLLSGRYTDTAGAKRSDEQEARGWLTGQQQQAADQYGQAASRQIQGYATAAGAAGNATGNRISYETGKKPGFWSSLGQSAVKGAAGAFFGG